MIQYFSKSSELGPLKQIPHLKEPTKILRISYPNNSITKISSCISKAQNVQQIDLSYNRICNMQILCDLRKLTVINISNNQIISVPRAILKLKRLQFVDLSNNLVSNMSNIGSLIELFRIRKGEMKFNLQGNKVMEQYGQEINLKMENIIEDLRILTEKNSLKQQIKQLEISKTIEMRPKNSSKEMILEIKESAKKNQNYLTNHAQINHNILNSLSSLKQIIHKMDIISSSQFKGWTQQLLSHFKQQSQLSQNLSETYESVIKHITVDQLNPTEMIKEIESDFSKTAQIQKSVKEKHGFLLGILSQCSVPMVSYKIWVELYKQLRKLGQKIRFQAWNVVQIQSRNKQLEALKLISPDKFQGLTEKGNQQLEGLLFSNSKQQKQNQNIEQCTECFIKNEQTRQLKQIVEVLTYQNEQLKQKLVKLTSENQKLTINDQILNKNLILRQQNIIQTMREKIDASVYQKVLLSQAKGIEDLIKCNKHIELKLKIQRQAEQLAATALVKKRTNYQNTNSVSDFTHHDDKRDSLLSKRPYFNKNQQNNKRSRRNTVTSLTSTEKKKKSTMFDGKQCSQNQNQSKTKGIKSSYKRENPTQISAFPTRLMSEQSSVSKQHIKQTNNVLISDFIVTQPIKEQKQYSSRQILAELVNKKCSQNIFSNSQNIKNNKKNTNNRTNDGKQTKYREYLQVGNYIPYEHQSLKLKNQKPYNDYMKYHLRNSIIETLQKKGKRFNLQSRSKVNSDRILLKSTLKESKKKGPLIISSQKSIEKQTSRLLQNSRSIASTSIRKEVESLRS